MQSDSWKAIETKPDYESWIEEYEGCLMCDCGHGCRQWIEEQRFRIFLIFRIQNNPNSTTNLDKVTKIPLKDVQQIYYRIIRGEMKRSRRRIIASKKANDGKL